ncbi:lytic transglycosylase domain-containing protein [Mesorhizobium sp. B2-3-4]|uniref:lytic transglycosylase domain-containing protein n=1 Tax=Mesorhizobium sp. B2-3-4 TaxID=2589959 RepID=UPI0011279DDA|nr:lytic transglycosylase domain-containing protein [Mesorhizobium sp. B2-3-4]TPM30043.1 lytic transglycosylase domain-containing protein [Mesorhizobium sp. B2-3-4]
MRARRPSTSHRGAPGPLRAARRMALLLLCGLSIATVVPAATLAQDLVLAGSSQRDAFGAHITEASQRFGVPTAWIRAIIRKESAGDARAVSSAGARGLMQIMPGTWDDLRARWSLGRDPFDPRDNILAGTAYLRELRDRFGSPGFLAAYNAGPARYEAYLAGRPLPAETRAYVAALARLVGDRASIRPFAVTSAEAIPWKHASLFADQPSRQQAVASVPAERPPNDAGSVAPGHDVSAIVPLSEGLFEARAGVGIQP